ncbi:MAG TPA: RDD family protein [Colwellia sp.]|nr:RDD family protein [Colwellia sp.]|tara:strand:- start:713 stop:1225 length:513 start_codon:yes stop_codon:yes gene_type:complete
MTDTIPHTASTSFPRAGFRRRFGSWIYDLLIVIAIFMLSGYVCVALFVALDAAGLIAITRSGFGIDWNASHSAYKVAFNSWCVAWVCIFFVYFWAKKGQTLGMKAWRLRVQNQDGSLISKMSAIKRLVPTLLGLGSLIVLFDRKNKLSLQDRLTNSEVVVLSLEANRGRL